MSVSNQFVWRQSEKRANELKEFLLKLDSICDTLYNNLEYSGVYDAILKLEDVRIKYYVEFYEHDLIAKKGKKRNGEKTR